jgi:hypothetical protein
LTIISLSTRLRIGGTGQRPPATRAMCDPPCRTPIRPGQVISYTRSLVIKVQSLWR